MDRNQSCSRDEHNSLKVFHTPNSTRTLKTVDRKISNDHGPALGSANGGSPERMDRSRSTESLHPKASPKECAGSVEMINTCPGIGGSLFRA